MKPPTLFLSSTSDLTADRRGVQAALRPFARIYLYEDDRASGRSPERRCRQMIEQSDLFVCLLGARYGSLFPGPGTRRSIVEWELDTARAAGHVEIMAFHRAGSDPIEEEQRALLARLQGFRDGVWTKTYASSEELIDLVRDSFQHWTLELTRRYDQMRAAVWPDRVLALIGTLAALTPAMAQVTIGVAPENQIPLAWACAVTVAACFFVKLLTTRSPDHD